MSPPESRLGQAHRILMSDLTNVMTDNIENKDPEKAGYEVDVAIGRFFDSAGMSDVNELRSKITTWR